MESVIDCPICYDSDTCFEDTQEKFKSYMCFNCGFMSSSHYIEENLDKVENTSKLVNELKFFDEEREIYWYPSVVNMGPKGIIFPEGNVEQWVWKYAEVIDIPPNMREKYDGHEKRLDVENAKSYEQYSFLEACKDMGIAQDIKR